MTQQGMTAEQIYENLTARGMELKKGVATVLRLQSAWKLIHDEKRWIENFRHQCHKQAKAQQIQDFRDIAKDLAIEDFGAWLEARLDEQSAREARHELALKLMGEHAPSNPERRKLQQHGRKKKGKSSDPESDAEGDTDGDEDPADDEEGDVVMGGTAATKSVTRASTRSKGKGVALVDPTLAQSTPIATEEAEASKDDTQSTPAPAKRGRGRPKKDKNGQATAQDSAATPGPSHQAASSVTPRPSASRRSKGAAASEDASAERTSTPLSSLVLRPEEAEANKSTLSTLDQYNAAAQEYKELLQARTENKAAPGSLTGLPPSTKQVEAAKRRLKDLTQAMMADLA